jgi:predicted O-methyltransferase YrrM
MPLATYINDIIYGGSPYEGFDASPFPLDLQGWFEDTELFDTIVDQIHPTLIVEVGSWKGKSSHHLLNRALRHADASIICVDTWLGSSEHWLHRPWRASLGIKNGRPTLHEQFMANAIHAGLTDRIVPLPLPSRQASIVLERLRQGRPGFAQLVFIDGAHDQASVTEDIGAYWPLVSPGGVLIGDDYVPESWPGVVKAVDGFRATYADQIRELGQLRTRWYAWKRPDATGAALVDVTGAHIGAHLAKIIGAGL